MESCTFLGVNFQHHSWPFVSKIWKPSKNHWKQWSGGWKSLNGDGWMTPKPLKNHRVQWSVIKKVVNGDGQRGAKPSKNHWCQWFSQEKTIVSHPKKWPLFTSIREPPWAAPLRSWLDQSLRMCEFVRVLAMFDTDFRVCLFVFLSMVSSRVWGRDNPNLGNVSGNCADKK